MGSATSLMSLRRLTAKCLSNILPSNTGCLRACAYCKETFALILRKYAQNEDFEHNKDQFTKDDVSVKMSQDQLRYLENQREESYFDEDDSVPARPPAAAAFSSAAAAPLPHTQPSPATHFLDENPFKRRKI